MKKLISILGAVTITSSAIPNVIAASPYQSEETILKRNKRGGEIQLIQIAQQGRNAELAYQRAGEDFQRNQNHTAFTKAQQRFLKAQQAFNNSKNEGQQGLTQGANQLTQERSQKGGNNNNSLQAHNAERQGVYNKIDQVGNKIGLSANRNRQKVDKILRLKGNKRNKRYTCEQIGGDVFYGSAGLGSILGGGFGATLGGLAGAIYGGLSYAICNVYYND